MDIIVESPSRRFFPSPCVSMHETSIIYSFSYQLMSSEIIIIILILVVQKVYSFDCYLVDHSLLVQVVFEPMLACSLLFHLSRLHRDSLKS